MTRRYKILFYIWKKCRMFVLPMALLVSQSNGSVTDLIYCNVSAGGVTRGKVRACYLWSAASRRTRTAYTHVVRTRSRTRPCRVCGGVRVSRYGEITKYCTTDRTTVTMMARLHLWSEEVLARAAYDEQSSPSTQCRLLYFIIYT